MISSLLMRLHKGNNRSVLLTKTFSRLNVVNLFVFSLDLQNMVTHIQIQNTVQEGGKFVF